MKGSTNCQNTFQRNKNFRRFAYRIGNVLCITPWFDFEKEDLKKPLLNKACAITYSLILGILLITAKISDDSMEENIFEKLLSVFSSAISIFLTEFLIFGSTFIQQHTWKNFLRRLSATQRETCCDCTTIRWFYLQFTLGHVFFIGSFIYQGYIWYLIVGKSLILLFVSSLIEEYYCLLYTLVASNIALVIKCLYQDVNNILEKYVEQFCLKTKEVSEEKCMNYILHVGKQYRYISELLDYFNRIFGWVSLLIFWHAIVQLLRCANFILDFMDDSRFSWSIFVSILLISILNMCESASIILSCEMAASAGEKLERISHRLQDKFDVDSPCRRELFNLADIVRSHKPKFTAADFFVINKGTILVIIHITTTYLIIIIEFNTRINEAHSRNSA